MTLATRDLARELSTTAALVLSLALVLYLAILLPGRLATAKLRAERDELAHEVRALTDEVRGLALEARALDGDPYEIERVLRARLGFLRRGERVVAASR
jgi:hypothetical protein